MIIDKNMSIIERAKRIASIRGHIDIGSAQATITSVMVLKGPDIWILAFAIIIASVGLNVNSIPAIIGAMLISPLLGPSMGIGLALGINDTGMLKKAFTGLIIMTGIGITASTAFFLVSPLSLEEPTELLARTNPTIYDVFIALAGGLAAMVEVCRKEKRSVIAGAAIATALMPPLCTAGYGLATGKAAYFIGACYLYFMNSVFIALSTFLTTRFLKFPLVKFTDPHKQKQVNRIITAFTIILILPSIYSAYTAIKENNFNQLAKRFITENKNIGNSYIYDYSIEHTAHKPSVIKISIAGEALGEDGMEELHRRMGDIGLEPGQLEINQNSTFIQEKTSDKDVVKSIFEQNEQEILKREKLIAQMEAQLKELGSKRFPSRQIAQEIVAQYPQMTYLTLARGDHILASDLADGKQTSPQEKVIAILGVSSPLDDEQIKRLEEWLAIRLNVPGIKIIIGK